jgi:hypothetical protein
MVMISRSKRFEYRIFFIVFCSIFDTHQQKKELWLANANCISVLEKIKLEARKLINTYTTGVWYIPSRILEREVIDMWYQSIQTDEVCASDTIQYQIAH